MRITLLFFALLSFSVPGWSSEMLMYSSITVNETSNQVSLYASTSMDYSSYYYYQTWVYMDLQIDNQETVCAVEQSNSNIHSEVSCNYTLSAGEHNLDFHSWHSINANYRYYEITYCTGCYGYGDYYGYSLLPSGGVYPDNTYIYPPGNVVESTGSTVFQGRLYRNSRSGCVVPTGETSVFDSWGILNQSFLAGYRGNLSGGNFDYKSVREEMYFRYPYTSTIPYLHSDECYYPGSPYLPLFPDYLAAWYVGSVNRWGVNTPITNSYGLDAIGLENNSAAFQHYKNRMQSLNQSCTVKWSQRMEFSCSPTGLDWRSYRLQPIDIILNPSSFSVSRDGVNASFRPY